MNKKNEKWAIFWCDLLSPIIYGDIGEESTHRFLKKLAKEVMHFPDGKVGKPSLSTLQRKLRRYRKGGFDNLARKIRKDNGKARRIADEVLAKAVELKKEQPRRSPDMINTFLKTIYGVSIPRSTLYRHLSLAHATRMKLGIILTKVRRRWTRDHTHDLWVGDFEEGPYVMEKGEVLPTYLSAFIDCHSRYVPEGRYYLRENQDVLTDSLMRAFAVHGSPLELYLDNAKVYHSDSLKAACHRLNIRLIHRRPKDPAPGGLIERFFRTTQDQFEAEVRAGEILSLSELNRAFSAWLHIFYHKHLHSETNETPEERRQKGITAIRQVDMGKALEAFMLTVFRTVNRTFADIQINNHFYRVDPKFRGDRVQVKIDPFAQWDKVHIHSLKGEFLCEGFLHHRETGYPVPPSLSAKPRHNALEMLINQHNEQLGRQIGGIDYRKVVNPRPWPFHEFGKTVSQMLGREGGLAGLSAAELEALKKVYNQSRKINAQMVKHAFQSALHPTVPYVIRELKILIQKEAD